MKPAPYKGAIWERPIPGSAMWNKRTLLMVCAAILSAGMAFGDAGKLSGDLNGTSGPGEVDVIVQYNHVPTAQDHQKVQGRGGRLRRELSLVNGGAYTIPASGLAGLAGEPGVAYITPDRTLHGAGNAPALVLDYRNHTVNAQETWALGLNGAGIGVAVIDSGINNLPDLNNASGSLIAYSQDFTGSGNAADQYGHGSHVAGILAGTGTESTGSNYSYTFEGIAESVNLINLRVLDASGQGTDSEVISAIQTAIQLKNAYNIRVINLSLGRGVYESYKLDPLCQAVEQAWKAGIVVVVAAGNYGRDNAAGTYGYGTITAPGNDPYVITVGAINTLGSDNRAADVLTSYTSKGPTLFDHVVKPDLVAPGNLITSLYTPGETLSNENPGNEVPTYLYEYNGNSSASPYYFMLSGTSMATPIVSGAVALLLEQSPSMTPDQVKARLMKTAFKGIVSSDTVTDPASGAVYNEQADIFSVGAGLLDILAAASSTDLVSGNVGSALSPAAVHEWNGQVVLAPRSWSAWNQSVLWGDTVVWGTRVFNGTNASGQVVLWGDAAPWGVQDSSVLWGDAVLWGSSVLWGDSLMWGDSQVIGDPSSNATGNVQKKR